MVWMKDDMKFVKKKPKSFKAVYEDNPKGPTALKHPLMPWPPGTAKGESKGRKQDHTKKVNKKNDNMDENTVQYSVDSAGVPYPRSLWEATVEYHDYVQWNESFGVPVDTFDVFLNDYPKAVKDNIMKEYAEDSKKWGGQQQEHGRFVFI